ncbi:MAG: tetratricopeptide repeat protein, partial [Sphaerochaeta associata]|uniref:tetratricopeptide repeat protein n=1 Tax=Sphaerochaeta associata TaxID=1129264 RepID=UPI002B20576D
KALHWFKKAAASGGSNAREFLDDADTINDIGEAYFNGDGITKDHAAAFIYFMEAANKGSTDAQYSVGWCYYTGTGVSEDNQQALYWCERAASNGNYDARELLQEIKEYLSNN